MSAGILLRVPTLVGHNVAARRLSPYLSNMWKIIVCWNLAALFLALIAPWPAKYPLALMCFFAMIVHMVALRNRKVR